MTLRYEDMHGGESPTWTKSMSVAWGKGRACGAPMASLSYAKRADGHTKIYKHELKAHDGRRPYLVTEDGDGQVIDIERPPRDLTGLGRAIDCVLTSGERIMLGGLYVVTDKHGDTVLLASPTGLDVQIEQRGAVITDRGIED